MIGLRCAQLPTAACSPVVGRRPPVGPPIGTRPHIGIGTDAGGHVFYCAPHLHTIDSKNGVGIVRFVQWLFDGAGDFAGHGDSGSRRDGRRVEEFPVDRDEAAL